MRLRVAPYVKHLYRWRAALTAHSQRVQPLAPGYLALVHPQNRWGYTEPTAHLAAFIRLFLGVFMGHGKLRSLLQTLQGAPS